MKSILSLCIASFFAIYFSMIACAAEPRGKVVKTFDFEDPLLWCARDSNNIYYREGHNNFRWGRKSIFIRPCQGRKGTGLMFDVKGISQGEMQFWSPPWPLKKGKFYKVSYWARARGFDGKLDVRARGISGWGVILHGHTIRPTEEWKEYSFSGQVNHDDPGIVDYKDPLKSFGIMFSTADLGAILIDDIKIEEFDENPSPKIVVKNPTRVTNGNILPNSSLETGRNNFWTASIPQPDPVLHFTDPGFVRREGGKFGKYCYSIEPVLSQERGAGVTVDSLTIPVASGVPYTFSFWYNGNGNSNSWVTCTVASDKVDDERVGASKVVGMPRDGWGEWKRCVITTQPIPDKIRELTISFLKGGPGEFYLDGLQLEAGEIATDYKPTCPYEIEATVKGGMPNIVAWGEKLPIELTAYKATDEIKDAKIPATLKLIAYPDKEVYVKNVTLYTGKTQTLKIDPKVNGIYRIELVAKDEKLASRFENIAARLPKAREDVGEESFFGTHISVRPYYADYVHRIGIKWQRMHDCSNITKMKWGNPEKDVYRWHDESIDMMKKAGLYILGMPDYFSQYVRRDNKDLLGPIDNDAFGEWCRRVAEHYKGRIDSWEIINEPYMGYFYPGEPKYFVDTFAAGAKGIRDGNPNAKVLGWCSELTTHGFISQFSKDKISDIDASSIHMYFSAAPGGGVMKLEDDVTIYRNAFLTKCPTVPMWNTEGSWFRGASLFYSFGSSTPSDYIDSAACGSRIWLTQMDAGFEKFFFYSTHQTDGMRYRGGFKMLLEYDRTVTVAAVATSVTAWFVDGLKPQKIENRFRGVEESIFTGKGRSTYVVYRDPLATKPVKFDISKLPSNFLVCDVMGTDLRKQKEKIVELSKTPIFVLSETEDFQSLLKYCQGAYNR